MGCCGVAGVPVVVDEGGEGGMRKVLEVKHASASWGEHLSMSVCACGPGLTGRIVGK